MKKLLILMLLGALFVPMNGSAKADEVLYCQSKLVTGLYSDNGTWKSAPFQEKRYTIKFSSDYTRMRGVDDYSGDWSCFRHRIERVKNRHICSAKMLDTGETFIFDPDSKKFVYSQANTSTHLETYTPTIRAGTYEKF